jgi:SnoaL-like domain
MGRNRMSSRTIVIAAGIAALALPVVAQADWTSSSGSSVPQRAELYSITQIEATWHKATSKKNLDLMMSLWAPNGTLTLGGKTTKGKTAIRAVLSKAGPFQAQNHWVSETPAYKIRTTVVGSKATLYFECHYVDVDTGKIVLVNGISQDLQKINGRWLITKVVGSSPTLEP